jgi:hypothetical protein
MQNKITIHNNLIHRHPRIERESKTVSKMIELYCHKHHYSKNLCPMCAALFAYANERLSACRFQENKTTCAKCTVHCYRPEMRAKIREVMRYSGPLMIFKHPVLTIYHLLDSRRIVALNRQHR